MMKRLLIILFFTFCSVAFTLCNAQLNILLNFNGPNGQSPEGSVTLHGNVFYGMTYDGGAYTFGNIFSIDTNGANYHDLLDFDRTNGQFPTSDIILLGNTLFGMADAGGADDKGVVFAIDTNGSNYRVLLNFNGTNGAQPFGSLISIGSYLYGMTAYGGTGGYGCLFSIDTNGSGYRDLYDFSTPTGIEPNACLIQVGGKFYGTAGRGGLYSDGVIFSIDTNGSNYTDMFDFNNVDGKYPLSTLILYGNTLFGTTLYGGTFGDGVIFSIDTTGTEFRDLLSFNGTDGKNPYYSLTPSGNVLYGMTSAGGLYGNGVIFSIDTNGSNYADIWNFQNIATNGADPYGKLTFTGCTFYGMTFSGGASSDGVIFNFKINITTTILCSKSNDSICPGDSVILYINPAPGTTYLWSTGAISDSIQVNPSNSTTYSIIASGYCGALDTAYLKLTVVPPPTLSVNGRDSICKGDTVLLSAKGGRTYLWSTGQTTDSIKVAPTTNTTYTLTASGAGCNNDTTFTVNVVPFPVASIVAKPADSLCKGDSVLLSGSGGTTYKWSNGRTTSSIWVTPSINTTYSLYVNSSACPDSTTINIKINPATTASISALHDTICPFGTATLTATGSGGTVTYKWNNGQTTSSISVTDSVTTTYTATVYGECGSVEKSVTVVVIPLSVPIITGTSSKCSGITDTLTVSGGTTYKWNNGSTGNKYITGEINADSTVTVVAYNSLGCPDTAHYKITVSPSPTVALTNPNGCLNSPVIIKATATGTGPFTYLWSPGGQTADSITVNDSSQTYTVKVSNGCSTTKSITLTPDIPNLYACCNTIIFSGNDTIIIAGGVKSYQWSPTVNCLNPPICDSVKVTPTVTTTYTITGTDSSGCETERVVTIIVDEPCTNFTVPNVFTPDYAGPNGLNNVFYIKMESITNWSILIYDRWGKEMYNSKNPEIYWTGNTENGSKAPDGVYYYIITATCQNITYKKDGFVQLIR